MREIAQMFLDMPCTISENIEELLKLSKHLGVKLDIQGAILLAQIHKAIVQKDTKAAEFVRDTAGQKPTDKVDMEGKLTYTNLLDKAIGKEEM
ncbi:MAG: hypothetical protein EOM29_09785 [Bacteroidia bacterium]|nr:hypothetical protein [Bacteroidia bacterium]